LPTATRVNDKPFVIEGYQVEPASAKALRSESPPGSIVALFAYRTDVEQTLAALQNHPVPNDWPTTFTKQGSTLRRIAEMVCQYSAVIAAEATAVGLPTINIDHDFQEQVETGLDLLRRASVEASTYIPIEVIGPPRAQESVETSPARAWSHGRPPG
jgi:hypothetical protein